MIVHFHRTLLTGFALICGASLAIMPARGQSEPAPAQANPPELNARIELLTKSLQQTQVELAESRAEIQQLRAALEELLKRIPAAAPSESSGPSGSGSNPATALQAEERPKAQISQEDWDLLNAKVDEQRQTKVESGSKFRLKLSGIALFNAFTTSGQVDNFDLPSIAIPVSPGYSKGATGASVRQSSIGLAGYGPVLFSARTSADLHMDFFGGLPPGYAGSVSGVAHIKLARIRFDWQNTSAVAGLDYPFFSPNLPTSYMSIAIPAFASAGNLWAWTPTLRIEQRFGGALSPFKIEAGFLDPSTEMNSASNSNLRMPSGPESSRQPTYAVRLSANRKSEERPVSLGISGVYSPQIYFGGYHVPGWAGILDWRFPLLPHTELSGQFFTGRGIDGFGGAPLSPYPPQSVLFYNAVTSPFLADTGVIGGWSQFKLRLNAQNEFNAAAGTGGRNSADLRQIIFYTPGSLIPARNQMFFVNYIFKPRSDFVVSTEYRRFRTYQVFGRPDVAGQVGLAVGYLF
jgi:hypothetical protein